jgi:hypothetical protein
LNGIAEQNMGTPETHIEYNNKSEFQLSDIKTSFNDSHNAYSKIVDKIMDYDMFIKNEYSRDVGGTVEDSANFTSEFPLIDDENEILEMLNNNADAINNLKEQMNETVKKNASDISGTFHKSADMYRTQGFFEDVVEAQYDNLEGRIGKLNHDSMNKKRLIEINNYYYLKNKAQTRILRMFFGLTVLIGILHYMNANIPSLMNDTLYIILIGLMFAIFVIFLCYSLYDIIMRNDHNFDEYDYYWKRKVHTDVDPSKINLELQKDLNDLDAEVDKEKICQKPEIEDTING